eukprot:CAMPEP_0197702366 /NCGR_PEP_ID=MMETSP1338-20131121/124412_1 /TAXON_ID=43686 ORGANISM="Pelagodinium beii, Strain RCC1491" /NCGR_SAMPLE_ID=MMETSP1338 /ASSEMBLY_ACC=CAM_ASM_000754 /LENGTH=79 /DNA_ID=CAMNT_0043286189 /DNA_START=440 /DNA_END=679 /DNA_ORIENTATION=-
MMAGIAVEEKKSFMSLLFILRPDHARCSCCSGPWSELREPMRLLLAVQVPADRGGDARPEEVPVALLATGPDEDLLQCP